MNRAFSCSTLTGEELAQGAVNKFDRVSPATQNAFVKKVKPATLKGGMDARGLQHIASVTDATLLTELASRVIESDTMVNLQVDNKTVADAFVKHYTNFDIPLAAPFNLNIAKTFSKNDFKTLCN